MANGLISKTKKTDNEKRIMKVKTNQPEMGKIRNMKIGDKVQVYFSIHKTTPIKQGEISEFITFGGVKCFRLVGSNKPYDLNCATKIKPFKYA